MSRPDNPSHLDPEQLRRWMSGELPPEQCETIESHLIECETCAATVEHLTVPEQQSFENLLQKIGDRPLSIAQRVTACATDGDDPLPDISPATFDALTQRWKFESFLARGGVGEIWIASDLMFHRKVAVKCLRRKHAARPSVQARFIREAKLTAELTHPGVPCVLELHEAGPNSFYSMTLISGQPMLSAICDYHAQRRDDPEAAFPRLIRLLEDFVAVAKTIDFSHSHGIIHRDIKSDNIILGDYGQVTVVDWGGAKRVAEPSAADDPWMSPPNGEPASINDETVCEPSAVLTQPGSRIGTPAFMSPEQVRGDLALIDHRTDVHGLAALLYEIVTGRPPYSAANSRDALNRVLCEPPRRFAEQGIHDQDQLEAICLRGLAKDPRDRQGSASELASAIESWTLETMRQIRTQSERARLLSLTEDLMMMARRGHGIQWANPAFEHVLGWTPDELLGVPHPDLIHPDDLAEVDAMFATMGKSRPTLTDLEPRMLCKDGSYKWVSWTATRLPGENLVYFIGRDVDQRRRRERHSQQLLRSIPESVVVVQSSGKLHTLSRRASEVFAVEILDGDLASLPPIDFAEHCVHPADRAAVTAELQSRFETASADQATFNIRFRNRRSPDPESVAMRCHVVGDDGEKFLVATVKAAE